MNREQLVTRVVAALREHDGQYLQPGRWFEVVAEVAVDAILACACQASILQPAVSGTSITTFRSTSRCAGAATEMRGERHLCPAHAREFDQWGDGAERLASYWWGVPICERRQP